MGSEATVSSILDDTGHLLLCKCSSGELWDEYPLKGL